MNDLCSHAANLSQVLDCAQTAKTITFCGNPIHCYLPDIWFGSEDAIFAPELCSLSEETVIMFLDI